MIGMILRAKKKRKQREVWAIVLTGILQHVQYVLVLRCILKYMQDSGIASTAYSDMTIKNFRTSLVVTVGLTIFATPFAFHV